MKNALKILLILISFNCLFSGCKKYAKDDRRFWFKSPLKRLSAPDAWDLKTYYINGADSTVSFFDRYSIASPRAIDLTIVRRFKTGIDIDGQLGSGTLKFTNHKNILNINISGKNGIYNPFINLNTDWLIQELDENYLKISSTIGGINYEITFRKYKV